MAFGIGDKEANKIGDFEKSPSSPVVWWRHQAMVKGGKEAEKTGRCEKFECEGVFS